MLDIQKCCLVVVDIQGKLAQLMHAKENLFKNIQILIKAAKNPQHSNNMVSAVSGSSWADGAFDIKAFG